MVLIMVSWDVSGCRMEKRASGVRVDISVINEMRFPARDRTQMKGRCFYGLYYHHDCLQYPTDLRHVARSERISARSPHSSPPIRDIWHGPHRHVPVSAFVLLQSIMLCPLLGQLVPASSCCSLPYFKIPVPVAGKGWEVRV